jgi:L,D-transpeptidase catalytic domain
MSSSVRASRARHALAVLALVLAALAGGRAVVAVGSSAVAPWSDPSLAEAFQFQAGSLDPQVLHLALRAVSCAASATAAARPTVLTLIDYSRPSTEHRLWVLDLATRRVLFEEPVAHGKNTGDNLARLFSNVPGSLQSSLGLYLTGSTYTGRNGYSLRLLGLEPGVNDRALERAIVVHGADYVEPTVAQRLGRLGRSWGCPAVPRHIAQALIDTIKGGSFLFAYYPDQRWLSKSRFLGGCR